MHDFIYLFPQLFLSYGGIQNVNEDTLRAMTRAYPAARHRVLLYHNRMVPEDTDDLGKEVVFIPSGTYTGPSQLRFALSFTKALLEKRPDLILVGHIGLAPLAWLAQQILGVPYVIWTHGIEVWELRNKMRLASLRNADRIVAVSRRTCQELAALDPALSERTVVIPNAVRDHFRPGSGESVRQRLALGGKRVLLTIARLASAERYKGYDTVLQALPQVLERVPETRYVLVGDGDDLPRVRDLANGLGVSHAVVFAGPVPDHELPAYYNACDLFVMPSKLEGFGIVFIEALACGKPVIAGDQDGARDAVRDGSLGRMVDPDDPCHLARAILEFIEGQSPLDLTDSSRLRRECLQHFGFAAFDKRVRGLILWMEDNKERDL